MVSSIANNISSYKHMILKVMHDQGQGHGHVKVAKRDDFEAYLLRHLLRYPEYYDTMRQYLNFVWTDISLSLSFSFYRTSILVQMFFH